MQHTQRRDDQQTDRAGADHHHPIPGALPVQRGVQRYGGRLSQHRAMLGHLADRDALRLMGDQRLAPAAAHRLRETLTRRLAADHPTLVEPLAGVGAAFPAGAAGGEAAVHTRQDRIEDDPVPFAEPPCALRHDADHFVARDGSGIGIESRHDERVLGVGQAHVAAANAAELRGDPQPPRHGRQFGFGDVGQPHQSARTPAGVVTDLARRRGPHIASGGQVGQDRPHRAPTSGKRLASGTRASGPPGWRACFIVRM